MLHIIRGLPGSGKSTLADDMMYDYQTPWYIGGEDGNALRVHYEADMYHIDENGVYNFNFKNLSNAHLWCREKTRQALVAKIDVIVSNTFTTQKELQPYIDMALEHDTKYRIYRCIANYGSIHGVPEETMKKMAARFVDIPDEIVIE